VLLPLLALLTGAAIAAVVLNGVLGGERTGGTPAVAADTAEKATITLVSADYVGRPVDQVATQLSALGLTVERVQRVTADVPPNTVVAIDPAGVRLHRGQTVTVYYAAAPPAYGSGGPSSLGQETVRRDGGKATSSAASRNASVATPTGADPGPQAGDGQGPGNGSGGSSSGSTRYTSPATSTSATSSTSTSSSSSPATSTSATSSSSASG
jgi:serine/threonine-protein kinase